MAVNDGSAIAPIGSPQLPTLLQTYGANRPAWEVAGVDYHVGVPGGLALKDPATISMAGVKVDTVNKIVSVTGNDVTLDGYDFSLNGGWGVVTSAANTSILDSKFVIGSNHNAPIQGWSSASNLFVGNSTIDGNGVGIGSTGLVSMNGDGLTVQYSWLSNSAGDTIQAHGGGAIDLRYNLLEQGGLASGAHGDFLETYSNSTPQEAFHATIQFNTTYQHDGGSGANQGFMLEPDVGTSRGVITSGDYGNNTFVATGGNQNYFLGVTTADIVNSVTAHDNYFDSTGDFGLSPGGVRGGVDDGSSKTIFVNNHDMTTGHIVQDSNAPTSTTPSPSPTPAPAPAAPKIASFSTDSGVVGDGITNDNSVELKGTAAANSTIKFYDGSTQIGTTTASSTGSWDYITSVLSDAKHVLTATATNSSGQTSAASSALSVTVDTKAPAAPTVASDTTNSANQVVVSGNAEANSTIKVYDGTTQVGTATTNSSGLWNVTTSALSTGSHALTAKATDAAGNVSVASAAVDPVIGTTTPTSPAPSPAPAAPKISSFSNDSGIVGDHITSDNTLTLTGSAAANSTVKVYDATTQIGTATADATGAWHTTTSALSDGHHSFTATDTVSGATSAASAALSVTVDTVAPNAPVIVSDPAIHNRAQVSGTAEAGSTVKLYEGTTLLGTATTGTNGDWSVTTSALKHGSHTFVATASDAAGNTSGLSQPLDPAIGSHGGHSGTGSTATTSGALASSVTAGDTSGVSQPLDPAIGSHGGHGGTGSTGTTSGALASSVELTNLHQHWDHTATIEGTAAPYSQVKLYDGTASVGSVTAGADSHWSFRASDLSNKTHTFTAQQVDSTGHSVGTGSGEAILGSSRSDTLTSTAGNDILVGKGNHDTFVFAANFGHDVIKDFAASGHGQDTIQFSKSVFDSFASVLSHASQVGQDAVISTAGDTLTLKHTNLSGLNSHDFHFA
jgi:hypothetical protein